MKLDISNRGITSLAEFFTNWDCNPYELEELDCSYNQLTTLQGCPPGIKILWCSGNQLTTLQGCPAGVKILICSRNQLRTLQGCPAGVQVLHCAYNQLTTLQGCRGSIPELYYINNPLSPEWKGLDFFGIKKKLGIQSFAKGIEIVNRVIQWKWRCVRRFCDNLLEKWYAPDENGVAPYAVWSYRKFVEEINVL